MAEFKNTQFDRPGGYAMPKGATQVQRKAVAEIKAAADAGLIKLFGDTVPPHAAKGQRTKASKTNGQGKTLSPLVAQSLNPFYRATDPDTRLYLGDCRDVLASLPDKGNIDLIFADPPFNWEVPYAGDAPHDLTTENTENTKIGKRKAKKPSSVNSVSSVVNSLGASGGAGVGGWNDGMPRAEYERFTFDWLDACIEALAPHGSIFVNIPDDTAAEAVIHLKRRGLTMINWCIWHFRFGQNRNSSFIMSKVHVLYFAKLGTPALRAGSMAATDDGAIGDIKTPDSESRATDRIWNPNEILELSDRASIYFDPRTMNKESNKGLRVPMDVWYGKYWGRVQGNNKERRHTHHNQIPEIYLERVIKACSNVGGLVLDPFCGSGTTSTVARALGRRSITIEYSPVNAKSAWERITKLGMIPREDAGKPQSTAIFKSRRKSKALAAG